MHLYEKPAHVLHDMLSRREISARELTENAFVRMDAAEPQVGAYLLETRETARKLRRRKRFRSSRGFPAR